MPYKKREPVLSTCEYCKTGFESYHLRRRFCCDSCRVLAATERLEAAGSKPKNTLSFGHTVAASAVGSLAADAVVSVGKHITGHKSAELKATERIETLLKARHGLGGSETSDTTGEMVVIVSGGREMTLHQCKIGAGYCWLGEQDGTGLIYRLQAGKFELEKYRPKGQNEFIKWINPLLV